MSSGAAGVRFWGSGVGERVSAGLAVTSAKASETVAGGREGSSACCAASGAATGASSAGVSAAASAGASGIAGAGVVASGVSARVQKGSMADNSTREAKRYERGVSIGGMVAQMEEEVEGDSWHPPSPIGYGAARWAVGSWQWEARDKPRIARIMRMGGREKF